MRDALRVLAPESGRDWGRIGALKTDRIDSESPNQFHPDPCVFTKRTNLELFVLYLSEFRNCTKKCHICLLLGSFSTF